MKNFNPAFIEKQKEKLLKEKQRIIQSMNNFKKENKMIGSENLAEEGDIAQQTQDQKLNISIKEKEMFLLREIEVALRKIEEGSYGLCEESGEPIELKRLEKQPWARLSLHYAELEELEQQKFNYKRHA